VFVGNLLLVFLVWFRPRGPEFWLSSMTRGGGGSSFPPISHKWSFHIWIIFHGFSFSGASNLITRESHMTHGECRSNMRNTVHGVVVLSHAKRADRRIGMGNAEPLPLRNISRKNDRPRREGRPPGAIRSAPPIKTGMTAEGVERKGRDRDASIGCKLKGMSEQKIARRASNYALVLTDPTLCPS